MRYPTRVACVVVAAMALTGDPAAAQMSHQGQDISEHVVLRDGNLPGRAESVCPAGGSFSDRTLFRVMPDGTREAIPFTVPAGRHLVVTEVEWTVDAHTTTGNALTSGATVGTRVRIGSGATFNAVFNSRTVEVGAERGRVTGSDQLTTGFVVGAGAVICPSASEFSANLVRSARLIEIVFRGYLISTH